MFNYFLNLAKQSVTINFELGPSVETRAPKSQEALETKVPKGGGGRGTKPDEYRGFEFPYFYIGISGLSFRRSDLDPSIS